MRRGMAESETKRQPGERSGSGVGRGSRVRPGKDRNHPPPHPALANFEGLPRAAGREAPTSLSVFPALLRPASLITISTATTCKTIPAAARRLPERNI
uniref:Uncharacterized protein n=1 Tax=Rangifer tarandus platyrhynchus TaxID=3082113 RepID=A0ACB0E180_RANTA|nr:unnamed protein product [Rangifer tarandus platyrhynchus]